MKSTFLLLIIFATTVFSGCKKTLELQPAQSISIDEALSTDEGVKQVLVGAYNQFAVEDLFGGNILRNAELYGGQNEIIWLGTYTGPREIFNQAIIVTNEDVQACWDNAYNLINICNNVLSALSVVNEADRNRVEGEAKFLRGWMLFELTKFFGQQYETGAPNTQPGVPVILTPSQSSTDNAFVARNTVQACYDQVVSDLEDAKNLLPQSNGVFADAYAASALLARVYLQQGNYEASRDEANDVIASDNYSLVNNYADEFAQDNNTVEDIFAIQISDQDGINAMNEFFSTSANGGRGDIQVLDNFVNSYDPADARKSIYYKVANKWRTGKFNNRYGNVSVIRLAEMYLTRAECNERLGTSVGAFPLDDYNMTHVRAGLPAVATVTLDEILTERHFELAHEGFLVHDLKRRHEDCGPLVYNDVKMVFPIPQREMEVNANLEQNPGY